MIRPVQPEKEHLQRNDISDLNLNQRHLPPVRKYQIVFQLESFLSMLKIGVFRSKMALFKRFKRVSILWPELHRFWSFLIENGDFEHFPDRDNSYLGCENECRLSLTLLIIISNLTRS